MDVDVRDRTDPGLISTSEKDIALPEEIARLHNWPEKPLDTEAPETGGPETEPVTVAVMDSGIHPGAIDHHPWFEDAEVIGHYDAAGSGTRTDQVGHGTGVASLIARMAPSVNFIDVKIFGAETRTGFSVIRRAYEWLIENGGGIDLVNMSWGARRNIMQINQLHERLVQAGIHDVVAAGNTGTDGGSPATAGVAFSAGALTEEGVPARFSSFNPDQGNPDIATVGIDVKMARAPGTKIGSFVSDDFVKGSGTSFSAPLTTAAYATALSAGRANGPVGNGRAGWDERLTESAEDIEGTPRDGAGMLKLPSSLFEEPSEEESSEGEPPEEDSPEEESPEDAPPEEDSPEGDLPPPPTLGEATFRVYRARAAHVIDGDTVDVIAELGFGAEKEVRVRAVGVDTAEIFFVGSDSEERQEGERHKAFAKSYLRGEGGDPLPLRLEVVGPAEDYGQWIGDLRAEGREKTLSEALIEEYPSVEIGAEEPTASEPVDEDQSSPAEEPEPDEEEPTPDEEPEPAALEDVSGIGPTRAEMLREAGYERPRDVGGATAEELSSATGLSEGHAQNLIDSAAEVY
jgi:predicted flap endonuclease-1-like 5' DNA nuclease